jgi:glucan biosynthesis protein C
MNQRLAYLDNLKVVLVVGVIAVHTAITYGLDGSWYLESYDEMSDAAVAAVAVVLGIGWLFGLGLFFLIAGRLSAPSLERKGPGKFARDRLVRLGIPLAGYTLLISPFLEYVDYRWNGDGERALWPFVRDQVWHLAPGPTWFLEALLGFSLAYALLRSLRRGATTPRCEPLRGRDVAAIAVGMAAASFAARFAFPLGSEQVHLQLAMFPQYAILFAVGAAVAGRLAPGLRRGCALAGALAACILPVVLLAGGFFEGDRGEARFAGGWHWQAAAAALLEGVTATCVSLWAVDHARRRRNHVRRVGRRMARATYGAFLVHPPVLVGLALVAHPLPVPAELKFVAVLGGGVAGSFGLARALISAGRRARGARRPLPLVPTRPGSPGSPLAPTWSALASPPSHGAASPGSDP